MPKNNRHSGPVNANVKPDSVHSEPWLVRLDLGSIDARYCSLSIWARMLVLILDSKARMHPFLWTDNPELSETLGCEVRWLQKILSELERAEWILPVYSDHKERHRLGIIMRKRVGPGAPGAHTPERLAEVESAIRTGWRPGPPPNDPQYWMRRLRYIDRGSAYSGPNDLNAPTSDRAHMEPDFENAPTSDRAHKVRTVVQTNVRTSVRQNKEVVFVEEELKNDWESRAEENPSLSNENDANKEAAKTIASALDRVMVDVRQAASMAEEPVNQGTDDLPEGWRRFLDEIGPDRLARFRAMSLGRQCEILEPHRRGLDRSLLDIQAREIDRARTQATIAKNSPMSITDLIQAVWNGGIELVCPLAEALCRDFGTKRDRRLWAAFKSLADQVWRREVASEIVIDSYRQAMGPKAKNRGAVFTKALRNHGWRP